MAAPNTFFPRQTNIGIPLTSEFFGGESDTIREIPPEWRAALDLKVIEIPMPWDVLPVPLSDTVLASKAEMKVTAERMRRTTYKPPGQVVLTEVYTDKDKQLGSRTRTFKTVGASSPNPTAVQTVSTKNLGNLHFTEDVETVPTLFTEQLYKIAIIDPVPEEFRVLIPLLTQSALSPGIVAIPTLGVGQFEHEEKQENVFVKRDTVVSRDLSVLPQSLPEYEMTSKKQVATVIKTLDNGLQTLTPSVTTVRGEVKNLGNNTSLKLQSDVPLLFPEYSYTKTIPDIVPEEFKVLIPLSRQTHFFAGTAVDPTLGVGEFEHTSKQTDVFTVEDTTVFRNLLSLPASLTSYRLTNEQQVMSVIATLDNGLQTLTPTATTLLGEVKNLGNGTSLRTQGNVPTVFGKIKYSADLPGRFQLENVMRGVVPMLTFEQNLAGNAAPVSLPLAPGYFTVSDEDVTALTHRTHINYIDTTSLPKSITEYRMSPEQQLITEVSTLDSGLQTVVLTATTANAEVINLGNGLSVKKVGTVPVVFARNKFEVVIPNLIPPEMRAAVPLHTNSITVSGSAAAITLPLPAGYFEQTDEDVTALTHRTKGVFLDTLTLPISLTAYKMSPEQQLVTEVSTLATGLQTITPTATTVSAEVINLGNGLSVKKVGTVPVVFARNKFEVVIPNLIPPEMRAVVPLHTNSITVSGSATAITLPLPTGYFESTDEDVTALTHRTRVVFLDTIALPVNVTNYKMSPEQQLVTEVSTLALGLQTISPTATTVSAEVTDLGNGMSIKKVGTVPVVFARNKFEVVIPNVIPPEMRTIIPLHTNSTTVSGTAAPITLPMPVGYFEQSDEDVTALTHRTRGVYLDTLALPVSLTSYKMSPEQQLVTEVATLDNGLQTITVTPTTVSAEVINLGNGMSVKKVGTVPVVFARNKFEVAIPNLIPAEMRAAVPLHTNSTTVSGSATTITLPLPTGYFESSDEDVTAQTHRTKVVFLDTLTLPISLTAYKMSPEQQLVTEVSTLATGLQTITPSATTVSSEVINLGNGLSVKKEGTVAAVFARNKYSAEIPNVIPLEMRAIIPILENAVTTPGSAAPITVPMPAGVFKTIDEDVTALTHRVSTTTFNMSALPVSLTEYQITREQQLMTIVNTLAAGLQTITPTATMLLGEIKDLGNGTSLKRVGTVPSVFARNKYSVSVPNLIPVEMRAAIPLHVDETTVAGNAAPITLPLPSGFFASSDEDVTALTHRTTFTYLDAVTLPVFLSGQEITEQFGGGVLNVNRYLNTHGLMTVDTGLLVVSSVIKDLGNGLDYKETRLLNGSAWPSLSIQLWDEEMQVWRTESEQVVAAGTIPTSGTYFVQSIKPIDVWRSKLTQSNRTPTAISSATALITYDFRPYQFPGTFDYSIWYNYQHNMGYRKATAMLTKHTNKTWWISKTTPPTVGATGSGSDVEVDEIYTDTVSLPVYSSGSLIESQRFPNILHDDLNTTQGLFYPATSPTFSDYYYGTPGGGTASVSTGVLTGSGTGYVVGDVIFWPGGFNATITAIGSGGVIAAYSPASSGSGGGGRLTGVTYGPNGPITGGHGSGATGETVTQTFALPIPGTAWVGTPRTISAKVTPTEIPNLWKIQTSTVVMR